MSYGSEVVADALMDSLLTGEDITIPHIDFTTPEFNVPGGAYSETYKELAKITNEDLTTRVPNGDGVFDSLMAGIKAHLQGEFDKNRISGAEYTKAFIALTESALANSVQFLLGRDAAFWQAANAQTQAITARVQLETAKAQYASVYLQALTMKANYALTKIKLATEDATYAQVQYNVANLLPVQYLTATAQKDQLLFNLSEIAPQQANLLTEQVETQRAQTSNTRTDGTTPVAGVLGKQRDLYNQQITTYEKDSQLRAAKLFTDSWTIQKTIDEGAAVPTHWDPVSGLDPILAVIKTNNGL